MVRRIALALFITSGSTQLSFANQEYGIIGGSLTYGESVFSTKSTPQLGATPNLFLFWP